MARQGRAGAALTISTVAGAVAGIFSTIVLMTTAAPIAGFALKFGPFEMFCLTVFGLSIISGVSEGSTIKGLIMGALGMFFASVGRSAVFDVDRFTLGYRDLPESDLRYIPLMIGVFAVAEALSQIEARTAVVKASHKFKDMFPKIGEWKRMIVPTAIGSVTGTIVGAIPGTGGDIASFLAYDQARKVSRRKHEFGKGAVEGVAAPEAANNAVTGGAMIPMLTLGIPGDSVTAVLIGAMIIMGMQPGPALFTNTDPHVRTVVTGIFAGLLFANIIVVPLLLLGEPIFARVISLPAHLLWPLVTVFCVVGSFSMTGSMVSVYIMLTFGVFGYVMRKAGFPPGPLIIGMILGPIAEANLHRALNISQGPLWSMLSPISAGLLALAALSMLVPWLQSRRTRPAAGSK